MTTYGLDVSHFQSGLSLHTAARNGYQFVFLKATEGATYKDASFGHFLAQAQDAKMLTGAYHFLHSSATSSVSAQVANYVAAVPDKSIPVAIDCEPTGASRPTIADASAFRAGLVAHGYKVSLGYFPSWYVAELGNPNLRGFTLWESKYGTDTVGSAHALYPGDTSSRWADIGGAKVGILQFASRDRIPGYGGDVDADAYRGTRAQLAATGWFRDYAAPVKPARHPFIAAALRSNQQHTDDLSLIQSRPGRVTAKVALAALAVERRRLTKIIGG
jgi:GH25 family lysozyme M1 (1,4-beta-N-acetylmuramidase)